MKARKWLIKSSFEGPVTRDNFEIVEEELASIKEDEFLLEALWISVDPYMKYLNFPPGSPILAGQVARVIETKHADYRVGDVVFGTFTWATHTICNGDVSQHLFGLRKIDPTSSTSPSTALGILGMTGATAYFGLLEVCQPKAGETLVVNAAAGAVGSAVGQIGKIKGMRVVGFAGSDKKVAYLKSIGFDAAYNYKTISSLSDALKEGCPNGVDVFFDNVGGAFFETVLSVMNTDGRVGVCGVMSQTNLAEPQSANPVSSLILTKQLTVKGFVAPRFLPRWNDAFKEISQWIAEGKL